MTSMDLQTKCNPVHTALVVIDIQNDFVAPDGLMARRGRDMSAVADMMIRLKDTIAAAEQAGVLVLYAKQVYDYAKLTPLQREQYDLDGKMITCDVATDGHELYGVDPDPQHVFVKYNYNVFSNPHFQPCLDQHAIKTLVITGVDTCYCVETAIRNGFDLGYKIVVPRDLTWGSPKHQAAQDRTLWLVDKTYGVVTTSEELKNVWLQAIDVA